MQNTSEEAGNCREESTLLLCNVLKAMPMYRGDEVITNMVAQRACMKMVLGLSIRGTGIRLGDGNG